MDVVLGYITNMIYCCGCFTVKELINQTQISIFFTMDWNFFFKWKCNSKAYYLCFYIFMSECQGLSGKDVCS